MTSLRARRTRLLAGLLTLVLTPVLAPAAGHAKAAAQPLRVDFIDVGQGDATLVTSPTGKTVLIDGGPHEASDALVSFLRTRTRRPLDLIILTHRHADHLGGLRAVVETIGARLFLDAPVPHAGKERERLMRALAARGVAVRNAERGRTIDLGGGASVVLLTPPEPPLVGTLDDVNANSVVARLTYGRVHFLFMGDASAATERWLLAARVDLRAQVLKVGHHGSRTSSTASFLAAVRPRLAVVSVGAHNDYHHPAPSTLARLERAGAVVHRTDLEGTLTAETDGRTLSTGGEGAAP